MFLFSAVRFWTRSPILSLPNTLMLYRTSMGILDDYFIKRRRGGGNGSSSPFTPRASDPSPRELALEGELAALRREQASLVRAEAAERANLTALQDRLDTLANEIDTVARRTRDPELRERGARMIAGVRANASQYGASRDTRTIMRVIKYALGIEPSPWAGPAPAATPAQPTAVRADPQAIVDAGAKLRGDNMSVDIGTGQPRPLPSPMAKLDPVARGIIRQGRIAKNEKLDD
jgi:hypothetical protein